MPGARAWIGNAVSAQNRDMLSTNGILIFLGLACLLFSFIALRKLMPQPGRPPSAWTSTNLRSTVVALGVMALMVGGLGMLIQGLVS